LQLKTSLYTTREYGNQASRRRMFWR